MPLDTSIPLQVRQLRGPDQMAGLQNALAIKSAMDQQNMNAFQMQRMQREDARSAGLRNALSGAIGADGQVDWSKAQSALVQAGDPASAVELQTKQTQQNTLRAQQEAAELDKANKKLGMFAGIIGTAKDDASYQAALQRAASLLGPQVLEGAPQTYDPQWVEASVGQALSAKDRIDAHLRGQTFEETKRHNRAMEARPVAGVTVINGQQTAEQKEIGKDLVKQYSSVRETADNAQNEMAALEQLRAIDVNSGRLEETKAAIASYAQALGIDPTKVGLPDPTNPQAFIGTAQQLVLRVMQAQKGPQTENDAKRIEQTVASLKNTPEAKDFLIDSAIAVRQRDIERADFYDAWREKNGTFDGARKAWRMHIEKVPLLGNNPTTGRPVFFHQFKEAVSQANPGITEDQVLSEWRKKYGP